MNGSIRQRMYMLDAYSPHNIQVYTCVQISDGLKMAHKCCNMQPILQKLVREYMLGDRKYICSINFTNLTQHYVIYVRYV